MNCTKWWAITFHTIFSTDFALFYHDSGLTLLWTHFIGQTLTIPATYWRVGSDIVAVDVVTWLSARAVVHVRWGLVAKFVSTRDPFDKTNPTAVHHKLCYEPDPSVSLDSYFQCPFGRQWPDHETSCRNVGSVHNDIYHLILSVKISASSNILLQTQIPNKVLE